MQPMDIEYLLGLQNFRQGAGSVFASFFEKMTFLGELNTVLVIMALIYWCVSKQTGTYLMMGWSGNRLVNGFLKVTACAYRPWIRDSRIVPHGNAMTTATGYSFPSGHTMNAVSVFGGGIVHGKVRIFSRVIFAVIVILVGFSRNFLGVHTPQDVVVGLACGLLVMWLTYKLMQWIEAHPEKDWVVTVVGGLIACAVAAYAALKPYPADYDAAGKLLVDGAKMANDTFKGCGYSIAFFVGWLLERRVIGFSTEISVSQKLTRAAIGVVGFYVFTTIVIPLIKGTVPGAAGAFLQGFIQVFYIAFLFPCCFKAFDRMSAQVPAGKGSVTN